MANPWFRLYAEFATDPKVQMLSETNQRRIVMLFCLRCNGHVTLHDEEVTFLLRISNDEWLATKALFITKGFITEENEIINWDKRQFSSDTSKNRVAAYRERKKQASNSDVTLPKQKSNAIDTDTDTDKNKTLLSDKSDASKKIALEILEHLNLKAGRKYRAVKANISIIQARLKEYSAEDLKSVVDDRCAAWNTDPKMVEYLRPETLFGATKCAGYVGSLGLSVTGTKGRPWYISSTGIESKGKELGIDHERDEQFPAYKIRVYKSAGITPEMVRQANQDFGSSK